MMPSLTPFNLVSFFCLGTSKDLGLGCSESILYSFHPHILVSIMHVFMILISVLLRFLFIFVIRATFETFEKNEAEVKQKGEKSTKRKNCISCCDVRAMML